MNRRVSIELVAVLCGVAACGRAQPPADSAAPAPAALEAPLPPPAVGVYVTNETSGDLSVIDAATSGVIATTPLASGHEALSPV